MVRVAIIGGKLQGTEAVYLAKKAGFFSVLIDKTDCPAMGMCDDFFQIDVREKSEFLVEKLKSCDFILPATENIDALNAVRQLQKAHRLNVAFDFDAYGISSSKLRSDEFFHKHNIPAPRYFPEGNPPYIAKISEGSSSKGVRMLVTEGEVSDFWERTEDKVSGLSERTGCEVSALLEKTEGGRWVVQEYLEGRAYSIEVIGSPGRYKAYQVTEILVDKDYDCCLVTCPCPDVDTKAFSGMAIKIAELIQLKGIMDVEAICHNGILKVLEIDARLPSQTPTAVLRSTGVNFLTELHRLFCGDWAAANEAAVFEHEKAVAYEHIYATAGGIKLCGEGIMGQCNPLLLHKNLFGADEAITDFKALENKLYATIINSADSMEQLKQKRQAVWNTAAETLNKDALLH